MSAPTLSDRELDVLELTAAGLNQQQVADELGLRSDVVVRVAGRVKAALGAVTMPHAVALGYVRGLLGGRR